MCPTKTNPARGETPGLGIVGQTIADPKTHASLCRRQTRVIRRFGLHPGLAGAFFTLQDVSRATGLSRRAITRAISTGKLMVVVRFKDLAAFGESRGAER